MTARQRVGTLVLASAASLWDIRAAEPLPLSSPTGAKAFVVTLEVYRAQTDSQDKAEFRIGEMTAKSSSQGEAPGPKSQARYSLTFREAQIKVKGLTLLAGPEGWTWNGKPEPPPGSAAENIAAPTMCALAGQRFEMFIGSELPIQYFEKRPDGLFELKELKEWTGIKLGATVEPSGEKEAMIRDFGLQVRVVGARVPLEGVTLDVGPPMVSAHELSTTVKVPLDRYTGIIFGTEEQGFLLLKVKVSAAPTGEKREGGPSAPPAR